ncbi:hypothetical protein B7W89_07735 [Agrobacterium tumefaciens]|uniref:hypothetical protein n=1 Tax=Agrobacterium tumefaciens TaxID=358 RepID=UPI000B4056AC|nr:hypothetical protein [Agrobacterium tumefaciens]NSY01191.1 hypothetical protein [Agrobacterium tumefaciens]OVE92257.1 hypothetical protein B7W89_07735 [Agrobacterium tumefaciens]
MSMNLLCGSGPSIDDIRNVCEALKSTRVDYVEAFASGEDGPFARQELAQLQSVIIAFDAVIDEAERRSRLAAFLQQGRI